MLKMFAQLAQQEIESGESILKLNDKRNVQVKLLLTQSEADSIRSSASACGRGVSQYMVDCHNHRPGPKYDLELTHAIGRLRDSLTDVPRAVRDLHYALKESSANIARIFSDTGRTAAREFRTELYELRHRLQDLSDAVLPTLKRLEDAMIEPRKRALEAFNDVTGQNTER